MRPTHCASFRGQSNDLLDHFEEQVTTNYKNLQYLDVRKLVDMKSTIWRAHQVLQGGPEEA
eukprot:9567771-Heterocapsa_arctica.AAC.1